MQRYVPLVYGEVLMRSTGGYVDYLSSPIQALCHGETAERQTYLLALHRIRNSGVADTWQKWY